MRYNIDSRNGEFEALEALIRNRIMKTKVHAVIVPEKGRGCYFKIPENTIENKITKGIEDNFYSLIGQKMGLENGICKR